MALRLGPGEQVIVSTRPQARGLVWPGMLFLLVLAAAGFLAGWTSRHRLADLTGAAWLGDWEPYLLLVLGAAAVLALLRFCLRPLLRWMSTRYILTSRRLISRHGHATRNQAEISLTSVAGLDSRQDLLQRMLRSGTLIANLGRGRAAYYPDVPEMVRFKAIVLQTIEELPRTVMFDGVDMEADPDVNIDWTDDE